MKLIRDIGIDLGTANVLCYVEGRGIVLREPSVVAVDKNTGKVLQVGAAARNMLGRTPGNIVAVRPLRDGVISDYEMTEKMLEQFLKKINKFTLVKPRVIVSVPSGITEVEERAVIQAAMEAGARRVYLIEEPFAAALGAKLAISGPEGHMVVDIGGGTTDIAVLSLNGIATSSSIKVAGDTFDEAVAAYMRKHYGMLIGLNTAEEVKITIGCVYPRPQELSMLVKGRDAKTGLPNEVTISSTEMLDAFKRPARQIVDEVLAVLEHSSPELVADIAQTGIVLTGGGSLLHGMDRLLEKQTKPKPLHTESSLLAAMENAGKELEDAELKASLKDAGIGTPATRAAIIETLFARQYIVREKKNLVPTDKGLAVYRIVKDKKIADVEMTGMWETALSKIEAGNMDADTFRKGIEVYAAQITAELLSVQLSVAGSETCPCPKCNNGRILFYPKVAKCSNVDCTLTIFRNKCDKQLSDKQIVELVTKRKTGLIKGFKGKNGKAFDASLVLDEQFNVAFSFPEKKAKPKK